MHWQQAAARWFRPGNAVALLAGAVAVQALSTIPPHGLLFAGIVAGALLLAHRRTRWLGCVLLAAGYTLWRADVTLARRLPHDSEGAQVVVDGRIEGLPRVRAEATRFDIAVVGIAGAVLPIRHVRVTWQGAPVVQPCETWRLTLHLKRPRGLVDPGAFDFERYALEQGLDATGHVVADADATRIDAGGACLDRLRARISQGIADTLGPGTPANVLRALAFGDQQAMTDDEWRIARATGIPHLIAISGLHIALFAGFGVLLMRALWKALPRLTLRWPAPQLEAVASLVFALSYGAIAGLGLPTRRALVMIGVLLLGQLARRERAPAQGLAFAAIVLLAVDPACVLSAGFWLSFVGVGWLLFCLGGGEHGHGWRELVHAQAVASIGLLPLSVWFFGQCSLVAPLANLVAVPVICFCVLPLTVAGGLLLLGLPALGAPLLQLAGWFMQALWWLLERLADWPGAQVFIAEPGPIGFALALLGAAWLLAPRGVPARALGAVLMLPLLWPRPSAPAMGDADVLMLDVGQGLAMIVRTHAHVLVYDTGAHLPGGFDLGDAAVVPTLHALGVRTVDRLVLSHGDNDHAGGAAAVLAAFPLAEVSAGEPGRTLLAARQCLAGDHWQWDGVDFRVVHPAQPLATKGNERSCVIDVRVGATRLLLTGDIGVPSEPAVLAALADAPGPASDSQRAQATDPDTASGDEARGHIGALAGWTVLQVPHHGSKGASSAAFIAGLAPQLALVSAGFHNRFHHPHAEVVARYAQSGSTLIDTAAAGFVHVRLSPSAEPRVLEVGRRDRHPYWRE